MFPQNCQYEQEKTFNYPARFTQVSAASSDIRRELALEIKVNIIKLAIRMAMNKIKLEMRLIQKIHDLVLPDIRSGLI